MLARPTALLRAEGSTASLRINVEDEQMRGLITPR